MKKIHEVKSNVSIFAKMTIIWSLTATFGLGQSSISSPILIRRRQTIARWNCISKADSFWAFYQGETQLQQIIICWGQTDSTSQIPLRLDCWTHDGHSFGIFSCVHHLTNMSLSDDFVTISWPSASLTITWPTYSKKESPLFSFFASSLTIAWPTSIFWALSCALDHHHTLSTTWPTNLKKTMPWPTRDQQIRKIGREKAIQRGR